MAAEEAKSHRKLPLALFIILPFFTLFICYASALLLISFTSFKESASAEQTLCAGDLVQRISEHLGQVFGDPLEVRSSPRLASSIVRINTKSLEGPEGAAVRVQLSAYLHGTVEQEQGLAWIVDAQGRLLATSEVPARDRLSDAREWPITVNQSANPLLRAAAAALERQGSRARLPPQGSSPGFVCSFSWSQPNAELGIGVALPDTAFLAPLVRNMRIALLLSFLTSLLVALLGVVLAREITLPTKQIYDRAMRLASGDWSGGQVVPGQARELVGLADAFEDMARALRENLDSLEKTVAARTSELTALLREVHHRMKNNLSLAASMLSLQASSTSSPEAASALEEAGNRIIAMAFLYERLYTAKDLGSAGAKEYIESILAELRTTLIGSRPIALNSDLVAARLDTGKAATVGIVITELVTNACKYAFPAEGGGTVEVRTRDVGGTLLLEVSDDGKGFPAGFELLRDGGFGLTLVQTIASQYRGKVEISTRDGCTTISLRMEVLASPKEA